MSVEKDDFFPTTILITNHGFIISAIFFRSFKMRVKCAHFSKRKKRYLPKKIEFLTAHYGTQKTGFILSKRFFVRIVSILINKHGNFIQTDSFLLPKKCGELLSGKSNKINLAIKTNNNLIANKGKDWLLGHQICHTLCKHFLCSEWPATNNHNPNK